MHLALIDQSQAPNGDAASAVWHYLQQCYARDISVSLLVDNPAAFAHVPSNIEVNGMPNTLITATLNPTGKNKGIKKWLANNPVDLSLSFRPVVGPAVLICSGTLAGMQQAKEKTVTSLRSGIRSNQEREAYRTATLILAVSGMMKRELQHYYHIHDHTIKVLYPPVNTARFNVAIRQNRDLYRQQWGLSRDKLSFLFMGDTAMPEDWQLVEAVFAALQDDPRFELVVTGENPPIIPLPNILFIPAIQRREELYAAVDYTLLPGRYTPYGQSAIESVACGTPVVISHRVGAREVLTAQEAILLTDFAVDTWVNTLQHIDEYTFTIAPTFADQQQLTPVQHFDRLLSLCGFDPSQLPVVNR